MVDMEEVLQTEDRYLFPHFYTVCWLALSDMAEQCIECFKMKREPPPWLMSNLLPLYHRLETWLEANGDVESMDSRQESDQTTAGKILTLQLTCWSKEGQDVALFLPVPVCIINGSSGYGEM